ncbi:MAG: hypothetical protein WC477_01180 [Patescibacteria group bacterium]
MPDGSPSTPELLPNQPPQEGVILKNPEEHPLEQDEQAIEQSAEHLDDVLHAEEARVSKTSASVIQQASPPPLVTVQKDEIIIEVEKILEDGVGAFYADLPPESQAAFKQRGEAVATEIAEMIRTFKVHVRRLVRLISDWLKTIPGVNRYFLEQEAKIKTDRIMELVEARKEEESKQV